MLENGGFETGSLPPWTSNGWWIRTDWTHSGNYSAYTANIGTSALIRQDFDPIASNEIRSIRLWVKTWDVEAIWIHFFYEGGSYSNYILDLYNPIIWENGFGLHNVTDGPLPDSVLTGIEITGGNGFDSDLWLDDVSVIADSTIPNVEIAVSPVNPPVILSPVGGFFDFVVNITNNETSPTQFSAWTSAKTPNGLWLPPILGPVDITLPGGASQIRTLSQYVPEQAPGGTYFYAGYIGDYPAIWLGESFMIWKQPTGTLWEERYNGMANLTDTGNSIVSDSEGNVIVAGTTLNPGINTDYVIIKYNPEGVQQWVSYYLGPGNSNDAAVAAVVNENGSIYVTGEIADQEWSDFCTVKLDPQGNQVWEALYSGPVQNSDDIPYAMALDPFGNIIVTGQTQGYGTGTDYITIKYDSTGEGIWSARYHNEGGINDMAYDLAVDGNGNVYVTGQSYGSPGGTAICTIKYDSSGNELWTARYNGPGDVDVGEAIAVDDGGNVYVTGKISIIPNSVYDIITIKYDPNGNELWTAQYDGPFNETDYPVDLSIGSDGNIYVAGNSGGAGTLIDIVIIKYNPEGSRIWVQRYNSPDSLFDWAAQMVLDASDNVYVTGYCQSTYNSDDYLTIKYTSEGELEWANRYNGTFNNNDFANSISVDADGNTSITGMSAVSAFNNDIVTIKYSGAGEIMGGIEDWICTEKSSDDYSKVDQAAATPAGFALNPPCPNPFNQQTVISYKLQAASYMELKVYDITGREVAKLVDGYNNAGKHEIIFDAEGLTSGVYFVRLETVNFSQVQKVVLMK